MVRSLHECEPREARGRTVGTEVGGALPALVRLDTEVEGPTRRTQPPIVPGVRICADGSARSAASAADTRRGKSSGFRRNSDGAAGGRDRGAADKPWERGPR